MEQNEGTEKTTETQPLTHDQAKKAIKVLRDQTAAIEWTPKREWWRRGNNFLVTVRHHLVPAPRLILNNKGPNRWNVYAYIYPEHPCFGAFRAEAGFFQAAARDLPLHWGPTYFMAHRGDNQNPMKVTAFEVGSDYNHSHDRAFSFFETVEDASEVFDDANQLFDWLSAAQGVRDGNGGAA